MIVAVVFAVTVVVVVLLSRIFHIFQAPGPRFLTVLDALEIENPIVANSLIDQVSLPKLFLSTAIDMVQQTRTTICIFFHILKIDVVAKRHLTLVTISKSCHSGEFSKLLSRVILQHTGVYISNIMHFFRTPSKPCKVGTNK